MSQKTSADEKPHEYPAGHLNHLSSDQAQAFQDLKTLIQDAGHYTPSTESSSVTYTDETLLRFLRARKFVPKDALQQFSKTEEWRKEQDLDSWYDTIDVDAFEATRILYTHWTGRRDKRGIPLYVFKIGGIDTKKMLADEAPSSGSDTNADDKVPTKLRRLFATYEHLTNFVMPLCSMVPDRPYPEVPISQTCCIVDISGVGLRQFLSLKSHLQDASALATAHYPETLGQTFVVGAPAFFSTVWSWLQYWFDPVTRAKIFILAPAEVKPTLEKFIAAEDIPKAYGGSLDWDFAQLPDVDLEISRMLTMQDGAEAIPKGPIRWSKSADGNLMEAHALGTEAGKKRDVLFATVTRNPGGSE